MDINFGIDGNTVEQFLNIGTMHTDAAVRPGLAVHQFVRTAVNIDIAPSGIDLAVAVSARFQAAQPQNPGQNPVAFRMAAAQFGRIYLAGRTPSLKDRIQRQAGADFGSNSMPAARRAFAAAQFARTVFRSGNGVSSLDASLFDDGQLLRTDADIQK